MYHELLDNKKGIENLGWKFDSTSSWNGKPLCDTYNWKPEIGIWNVPTLTIYYHNKRKYLGIIITKFRGQNSYYGKMEEVFRGKCKTIEQLKMICKLLELDNYKKFR
jgi:hypothetical protein